MYKLLRTVHLLLGLSCSTFLLMYSVSAVQMAHVDWFSNEETVTQGTAAVSAESALNPRALAQSLMQAGMSGELQNVEADEAGFRFRIVRVGTVHTVSYSAGEPTARLETRVADVMGMMNGLHHMAGFYREQGLTHWWGAFVAFASLALLGLGLTGVYLWFRMHKERLVGGVLLSAGLVIGVGLLVATRLQP